jgi:hypothetical protein
MGVAEAALGQRVRAVLEVAMAVTGRLCGGRLHKCLDTVVLNTGGIGVCRERIGSGMKTLHAMDKWESTPRMFLYCLMVRLLACLTILLLWWIGLAGFRIGRNVGLIDIQQRARSRNGYSHLTCGSLRTS